MFQAMYFLSLVMCSAALAGMASAASVNQLATRATSSHDAPQPVTKDTDLYSQAAGLCQACYCHSPIGQQVGDSKLLWQTGSGIQSQRALMFHSDKLGIAVAFEGTNFSNIESIAQDTLSIQVDPDRRYKDVFPHGTKLFYGFQDSYVKVADQVLSKAKQYLEQYNETRFSITGHSQGGAMGLIAAAHLNKVLEHGVYQAILFGLPRTGNPVFADFVDESLGNKMHWIINGRDWNGQVPPRYLNYQQPSNLIWINPGNSTHYMLYPGQENVHGIDSRDPYWKYGDHQGVYFHTQIGVEFGHCPATVGQD